LNQFVKAPLKLNFESILEFGIKTTYSRKDAKLQRGKLQNINFLRLCDFA